MEGLERQGHHVRDRGDILAPRTGASREKLLHYEQVSEVNRRVYLSVTETLEEGRFPVILGGDHSIAAGSIAAVSKRHSGNIGVIWIDAHGDWNSEESTCTGNMHGMPFSAVCGYGPDCMVEFGQERRRLTWLTACRSADGTLTIWSGSVWRKRGHCVSDQYDRQARDGRGN